MNQVTKIAFGPVDTGPLYVHPLRRQADHLRTVLRKYLLDSVLPALALLSMSVVTAVTIVLVVTAVADAGWHLPARPVGVDPSAGWYLGPAGIYEGQAAYPGGFAPSEFFDDEPLQQVPAEAGADTPYAALAVP